MSQVPNDKKHLTPRQIINRYKKGDYVDESIEAISSTISSCPYPFDCVAVPFPVTIVDKVLENIGIAKKLYELQKVGKGTDDIEVPYYPQLRDILLDLSYPPLWEAMQKESSTSDYIDILFEKKLICKYHLAARASSCYKVVNVSVNLYKRQIEGLGLSSYTLLAVLSAMFQLG
jgi:hypothetical protein